MRAPHRLNGVGGQPADATVTLWADDGNGGLEKLNEFGFQEENNKLSCYILTAPGCVITAKVFLRSDKSSDVVDLVVDGVLRNSITNAHRSRVFEPMLERALYQQKINGKKFTGLQYCQMEVRPRNIEKGSILTGVQNSSEVGTISIHIFRNDATLGGASTASGPTTRAPNFADISEWYDFNRNISPTQQPPFEIGFINSIAAPKSNKKRASTNLPPDYKLWASFTFRLQTTAQLIQLGYTPVPVYYPRVSQPNRTAESSTPSDTASSPQVGAQAPMSNALTHRPDALESKLKRGGDTPVPTALAHSSPLVLVNKSQSKIPTTPVRVFPELCSPSSPSEVAKDVTPSIIDSRSETSPSSDPERTAQEQYANLLVLGMAAKLDELLARDKSVELSPYSAAGKTQTKSILDGLIANKDTRVSNLSIAEKSALGTRESDSESDQAALCLEPEKSHTDEQELRQASEKHLVAKQEVTPVQLDSRGANDLVLHGLEGRPAYQAWVQRGSTQDYESQVREQSEFSAHAPSQQSFVFPYNDKLSERQDSQLRALFAPPLQRRHLSEPQDDSRGNTPNQIDDDILRRHHKSVDLACSTFSGSFGVDQSKAAETGDIQDEKLSEELQERHEETFTPPLDTVLQGSNLFGLSSGGTKRKAEDISRDSDLENTQIGSSSFEIKSVTATACRDSDTIDQNLSVAVARYNAALDRHKALELARSKIVRTKELNTRANALEEEIKELEVQINTELSHE